MINIVFVSGHYPNNTIFANKTKILVEKYTVKHNYGFYYNTNEITETYTSSLHFIRCMTLSNAAKQFPDAKWFVWLDSDVFVNPKNEHLSLESQIDITNEDILYHTFHEAPWGLYPINTGVKIINKKAIKYEEEMWQLRNTSPWNEFPYEQKTLYEYIFPKLKATEYTINDPYILNCITKAYPDKIHNALFIHMCAMTEQERNNYMMNTNNYKKFHKIGLLFI
jgi:hypothetical protein